MTERLKKSVLYTYGVADMFLLLMLSMEMFYFTAFLTDYARFPMAAVGVILWVTGAVDLLCALLAGVVLQKMVLRFGGKYRSWLLIGPPLFAPLFILEFTKIGGDALAAVLIMFGFLAGHLLLSIVFTASGAMVGRLSRLPDEVTILSASRAQGMAAAGLVFSVTGMPMILYFGERTDDVTGFTLATAIYAVFMILGYWYVYRITSGKDPYDAEAAGSSAKDSGQSVREIAGLVFRNPPLLLLIVAETFRNTNYSIVMAFAIYYFKYVVNDLVFMSVFLLATSIAALLGSVAATWIGVRFGKRTVYWAFLVLAAAAFFAAKLLASSVWSFTALCAAATLLAGIASSMSTALFSDTVIYGEWKRAKTSARSPWPS